MDRELVLQGGQIAGALAILGAYVLLQLRWFGPRSRIYLVMNFVGAAVLATIALSESLWGFLLLEGAWAVVSLVALARTFQRPAHEHG